MTLPIEPIIKRGSITKTAQGKPPTAAVPVTTPSRSPDSAAALASFWL